MASALFTGFTEQSQPATSARVSKQKRPSYPKESKVKTDTNTQLLSLDVSYIIINCYYIEGYVYVHYVNLYIMYIFSQLYMWK